MTDFVPSQPVPPLPADVEAELDGYLAEIRELNVLIRRDQARIDRLKAESAVIRAETKAINEQTMKMLAQLQAA